MELDQQVAADRFNEVHRGHLPKPVRAFCEAAETPVSLDTTGVVAAFCEGSSGHFTQSALAQV